MALTVAGGQSQGNEVARYDKIHLFSFEKGAESFDEARTIRPGEDVRTFDAPFGRVGLSVCYDLRFPELYRRMGDCALIVVPSGSITHRSTSVLSVFQDMLTRKSLCPAATSVLLPM